MTRLTTLLLAFGLLVFGTVAFAPAATASTPEAWAELNQRVNRACVAMSGLARPELLDANISFSDEMPVEARLLRGYDSKGTLKRLMCLFDRRTGHAEIQELPDWNAPTVKP